MTNCLRCGRELSNPESILRKMGRKCYEKTQQGSSLSYEFYVKYLHHTDKTERIVEAIKSGKTVRRIMEEEKISYATYKKAEQEYNRRYRPKAFVIKKFKNEILNLIELKNEKAINDDVFNERIELLYDSYNLDNSERKLTFLNSINKKTYTRQSLPRDAIKKKKEFKQRTKRQLDSYYRVILLKEKQKLEKSAKRRKVAHDFE